MKAEEEKILAHKKEMEAEMKKLQDERDRIAREEAERRIKLINAEAANLEKEKQAQQR